MRILSLDQLLEESIGNVYRAWYTLPRRSTLLELDRLRTQLADALESLSQPVDLTAYEQALIDFAVALRALPGVADAGGAELVDLAEAVPTSKHTGFGPLLRKTDAAPERLNSLVALLRLENPLQAVIMRMAYAPDRAAAVWSTIWASTESRLMEMPEAERSQVEAVSVACEAAARTAKNAKERQEAYLQGLQALEKLPVVIRVAWRTILANKHVGEVPTYLHGTIDAFQPPPAPALPEMAVAMAIATPPEEQETNVSFFTDVRFPERVKRSDMQWLTVQLTLESIAESVAAATVPVRFGPTLPGELPPPEFVGVRLVAPGFSEITGVWERTITVYPQRDSQPAVFLLSSDKLGPKRLSVDFVHKGRMIASVAFKCEVVEGNASRTNQQVALEEKPEVAPLAANPPPPADLILRVARTAEANGLSFVLNSSLPQLPFHSQPLGQIKLTEKDPGRLVKEIESLGEGLFELLMPQELQTAYWEQVKPSIDKGDVKTLLIISDEPWIPWELIKPYRWNDASNSEQKASFLVEQVALSRWLARPLPSELTVKKAALVAPSVNLSNVQAETAFIEALAQQHHIDLRGRRRNRQST
jgi:hypothetical protein